MNKKFLYEDYINEQEAKFDISVYVLTYYHEKYIRQNLDSILSQKTDYSFEIIVSDDCSKDKTVDILKEYQNKFPDKIRLNLNETNIGIPENIYKARCMCRGRYIINIAGDDYFIDDCKLQRVVSFLDEHREYFALCERTELRYDDDNNAFDILPKTKDCNKPFSIKDYENGKNLNCHGLTMRNAFLSQKGRDYFGAARSISDKVDDAVDCTIMLLIGDAYILDNVSDVYRVPSEKDNSNNYNSKFSRFEKQKQEIELYNSLYCKLKDKIDFKVRFEQTVATMLIRAVLDKNIKGYFSLYELIPEEYRKGDSNLIVKSIVNSMIIVINQIAGRRLR